MHPDQLAVELRTVRKLLDGQFPHLRGASVEKVNTTGTVNAIFRIGPDLAETSTVPTNEPVALGEPGDGYPGVPTSDGPGLVLRRLEPIHEPLGLTHARSDRLLR